MTTKIVLIAILVALIATCTRVGTIEERLQSIQHALEFQRR